jgi:hypothetical protein
MPEIKTKATQLSVRDFISQVENATRRDDALKLLKLFQSATGWKPRMWGPSIIGYGRYEYVYDSGHSGEMCVCGFSPRKGNLVIYSGTLPDDQKRQLLSQLGKHKANVGCIYINKLADVDVSTLEKLIEAGVAHMKKLWPVHAS